MLHFIRLFFFAAVTATWAAGPALSQDSEPETPVAQVALPDPLTPEAVHELVARMSDDEVRALLLERLDAVAQGSGQAPESEATVFAALGDTVQNLAASWMDVLRNVPNLTAAQREAFANFAGRFGDGGLLRLFGYVLAALIAGFAAEYLAVFLIKRWQGKETGDEAENLWSATRFLIRRFIRELLGLAVFFYVVRSVGRQLVGAEELAFAALFVWNLIWLPRLGAALSRLVLAPERPDLRMVSVDDRWARYLHRNLIGLFLLMGFTVFIVGFNVMNGVPMGETRLGFWLNTAVHIYVALIAWTAREGLTEMMRGSDPDRTRFDETVARYYPHFAVAVSGVMWLVVEIIVAQGSPGMKALLQHAPHYATMFWLLAAPAVDTLIRGLVRHLQPPIVGEGPVAEEAYKSTKRSYIRIGRVIAIAFVILMIADVWNIDLRNLAAAGVGENFGGAVIEFLLIVALGFIVNEVASLWINRQLAREQTSLAEPDMEAGGEGGGAGGSRIATVLPLIRVSAQVTIAVLFGLLALGALGINIAPLLAGAGVVGLAIGFGAQKLVTDIVSGIFFLIDDAFRVGEYVDVGGTTGTVEKISIRSMQLRHHRGPVHTIPYGEIAKLTNFSRDWVIMKLKFTVPFDTDPNKVKKIFKKIGAEMMQDPVHKDGFLEPFKSQGVFDFDDVGMVIRGKFMAKPGAQFTIRKEIYNRVKKEFAEAGIEFARREVRVAIPGLEEAEHLSEQEKAAITAAASEIAQEQVEAQAEGEARK